jgi:hypothetical protein
MRFIITFTPSFGGCDKGDGPSPGGWQARSGTHLRPTGSLRMRLLFAMPLLLLSACDDKGGDTPRMSTNIVDEQASYDVSNETPAQDEALTAGNEAEASPPVNAPSPDRAEKAASSTPAGVIPAALQGGWTGLNDRCGDRSAELELKVTPDSLIFHESVGMVKGVVTGTGGKLRVDAAFTGEGDSWTKRLELRPSASGRELTIINDGAAVTRKRC